MSHHQGSFFTMTFFGFCITSGKSRCLPHSNTSKEGILKLMSQISLRVSGAENSGAHVYAGMENNGYTTTSYYFGQSVHIVMHHIS